MTIHDLIHLQEASLKYRLYYAWLRRQLRRAAGLLTVSQASADAIERWAGQIATVTYPGYEPHYRPGPVNRDLLEALGVSGPYFLYVGNPKPHKRFELALAASHKLMASGYQHQLVSVGVPASGRTGHLALNNLPELSLAELYRGAVALLLPSRLEGFGLPGVEALACGCPVLAADIPVLREVIPQAEFLPAEPERWRETMARLLERPRAQVRPPAYSWRELARRTREVYDRWL